MLPSFLRLNYFFSGDEITLAKETEGVSRNPEWKRTYRTSAARVQQNSTAKEKLPDEDGTPNKADFQKAMRESLPGQRRAGRQEGQAIL